MKIYNDNDKIYIDGEGGEIDINNLNLHQLENKVEIVLSNCNLRPMEEE